MTMRVSVPPQYVGNISKDLSVRRGIIHSVEADGDRTVVDCEAPLANLIGYASGLRGLTHGTGEWTMVLKGYGGVGIDQEENVLKMIRGY